MLNGTMKFLLSFSFEQFTFTARFFYPTKLIEVLEKMKVIVRILATYSVCVDVYVVFTCAAFYTESCRWKGMIFQHI